MSIKQQLTEVWFFATGKQVATLHAACLSAIPTGIRDRYHIVFWPAARHPRHDTACQTSHGRQPTIDGSAWPCRGLAQTLLPLQGEQSLGCTMRLAALSTAVTPHPGLRFAELHASCPIQHAGSWRDHARSLVSVVPRYDLAGRLALNGPSLLVARGGADALHSTQPGRCGLPVLCDVDGSLHERVMPCQLRLCACRGVSQETLRWNQ